MLKSLRNSKVQRIIAVYFSLSLLFEIIAPSVALALTSGPAQEEFASFEPASTTDMVDLYSGDYNYNIPLLSVPGPNGGYPINLSYHSGIGMEQEASWVGLGWTLNVGAINRNLQGLPDDYNGDIIKKTQHIKENVTASLDIPLNEYNERMGFPLSQANTNSLQVYYNNYRGIGTRYTYSATRGESTSAGLNISFDSQNGMGIGLTFNAKTQFGQSGASGGFGLGLNYNSRQGLQSFNFSGTAGYARNATFGSAKDGFSTQLKGSTTSTLSFATVFGVPKVNMSMKSTTVPFTLIIGTASSLPDPFAFKSPFPISGSVYTSKVANNGNDEISAQGYLNTTGATDKLKDFNRSNAMYSKKIPHLATSNFTYDLYTQTGQGTGSMFRPHLNTFGVLSDPLKISTDRVIGGGIELGVGGSGGGLDLHIGIDLEYGDGQNSSGPWTQIKDDADFGTELGNLINWQSGNSNIDYEPYYFQVIGEKSGYHESENQLADFRNDKAIRFGIEKEKHDNGWLSRHFIANDKLQFSETETGAPSLVASGNTKQKSAHKRAKRATSIEALTTAQVQQFGFSKNVTFKNPGSPGTSTLKDFTKPSHHISEISMLQADGMRYVYGLPAYNNKQIENVFALALNQDLEAGANVSQAPVNIGGSNNFGGINVGGSSDEYVSKNEMPAYAHSWLLTSLLSVDYLDVTGNGPTEDDFGYWVKFNYKKIAADYQWRVPYTKANFIDGFKNDPKDNKGSYTYGKKDIYVLESIETKTHISVFETSPRKDAFESNGEFNNYEVTDPLVRGAQTMQKLDKIKLFTKRNYYIDGNPADINPDAIPTKVTNFEYSYDLCPEVPNNSGVAEDVEEWDPVAFTYVTKHLNGNHGKLTLKKLYFTYQTSTRGALSPYVFNYGDVENSQDNPDYNKQHMDRWGNYKNPMAYDVTGLAYPYVEHPYTDQDPNYYYDATLSPTGLKPAPWTLKQISLPTGGTLTMEYEPDDYAYVENKQAMRMFDICFLDQPGSTLPTSSSLTDRADRSPTLDQYNATEILPSTGGSDRGLNRVFFKLEQNIDDLRSDLNLAGSVTTDTEIFKKLYLDNIPKGYVYFNVYSRIHANVAGEHYDYVKGYAEIDLANNYGITPDGDYGYFKLKNQKLASPLNITNRKVSPFTLAALQHLRANRSELIHEVSPYGGTGAASQILNLVGSAIPLMTDLMSTLHGFNNYAYDKLWGQQIQLNGHSTIRLCEPDFKKIGGGVRVKQITLNDNWKNNPSNTSAQNSLYGQQYDYTKTITIDGRTSSISSGVAYEPQVGSEESPLKTPIPYKNSIPLHGSYNLFMENPIMESYYPGANVGYSKVTVKSIAPDIAKAEDPTPSPDENNLNYSAAPATIHEFYTPKDFPVIFDKTDMNPGQPIRIPIMIPGLLTDFTTRQAKSQGYSVILNDMAGKTKAVTTMTLKNNLPDKVISRQKYIYNTEQAYNEDADNKLSSKVQTLEIDKSTFGIKYITSIIGQSHDMFVDMNEDASQMSSFGIDLNFDSHYVPPSLFVFMLMPIPTIKYDKSSLRTIVFNKVINRTGILKKVETTTQESTITTENLAYDIETGEPVLTKVTNEFKDPLFNFNYPGHWYYPNMGGAYQNTGLKINSTGLTADANGYIPLATKLPSSRKVSDYFAKGDLVQVVCTSTYSANNGEYHVLAIDDANESIRLINSSGYLFPAVAVVTSIKVLKSGFKNMQSTKVGSLVFKNMDPDFKTFEPADPLTDIATLTALAFEDASVNKIINASAVEYSNDWQVFNGPLVTPETVQVCDPPPAIFLEYLAMLQTIYALGPLSDSYTLQIYDEATNTFSYGFTPALLLNNLSLKNTVEAPGSQTISIEFSYSGTFIGGSVTGEIDVTIGGCRSYFHTTSGNIWNSISSYNNLAFLGWSYNSSYSGYKTMHLQGTLTDGSIVYIDMEIPYSESASCNPEGTIDDEYCCWNFIPNCYTKTIPNYACGITEDEPINPYLSGMKGMWKPKASYAYNAGRIQNNNIKEDGIYDDYDRFPWEAPSSKDAKWVKASTVTKYSPFGFELENKDALDNYSSAVYGYKQSLVTAIGSNAKYNEIAFDNFEDYPLECNDKHFKFLEFAGNIYGGTAHTGKYSISSEYGETPPSIETATEAAATFSPINDESNPITVISHGAGYVAHLVNTGDYLGRFSPVANKKYVASVWTKEVSSSILLVGLTNYTAPQLKITFTGSSVVYTFSPKGNVIDGWQQIFEPFDIPSSATGIKVELLSVVNGRNAFFDDIRIHPFNGNMVSYVYDPVTLKTLAELDANNYATIYVYDDEGHLNKVKKETTEGIKTIKEGRVNTKKTND